MYLKRTIEPSIYSISNMFPALLVTGPRQVGKTTLLQKMCEKERTYVSLDDPNNVTLAKEEPLLFFQRFPPPVLIDEIQYAPELLPIIKMYIDRQSEKGLFWLTGSQQFYHMKGISESLAGRVGIINLLGLSMKEIQKRPEQSQPFLPTQKIFKPSSQSKTMLLKDVYQMIWTGSFPSMWTQSGEHKMDRDLFYSSYVQTYLQRDVRDLANIESTTIFLKFIKSVAARTGRLLNVADIARDAGISPITARNWMSVLEASGIVYLVSPYHDNVTKRIIKASKLYFIDTGLCAYLTEWSSPETLEAGAMSGAIFETFVVSEILKSYWHIGRHAPLYFYRDKDKKEIDLLIVKDNVIHPIEIKKTASPDKQDIKNFGTLNRLQKDIGEGGVICLTDSLIPITEKYTGIPVGFL
ncbi:MAG: ATP-binding protein [Candidatus Margulisbacteria bacterium]|nr:ATP-binding protein [Candidatus Margulisiibacteriota bacterium]